MLENCEVIGIDLGGTAIKLGRFRVDGRCLASLTVPTPQPASPTAVVGAIAAAVDRLNPDQSAIAFGIGTPGPVDATGRIAHHPINLHNWRDVPLADLLEAKTGLPTFIANDANCAGLGESWQGAGRPFNHFVLITLGTGVGGAIILNRQLYTGANGAAGEIGLMTLDPNGPACKSGNSGSLEQYVSASGMRRWSGETPAVWGERANAGDPEALDCWQRYGRYLGSGLVSLIYLLAPEAIVIGGGLSASAKFFLPAAWQEIERRVLPICRTNLQLLEAQLGNRAGMVGAARLAWQQMQIKATKSVTQH